MPHDPTNRDADQPAAELMIGRAVEVLRRGGLVGFPTETVYGLGADATDSAAVDSVFKLKGRPATNPLIVHVLDPAMAAKLSSDWSERASLLADAFWPGPLTLVVNKDDSVPDVVTAGGNTVALRSPAHPVARALLKAFGGPLVGPSANPSGYISPTQAEHVRHHFPDLLVLDGGACSVGIESTVLRVEPLEILRPGAITAEQIERMLNLNIVTPSTEHPPLSKALPSPGMHAQHYAPTTPTHLIDPIRDAAFWDRWQAASPLVLLTWRSVACPDWVRHLSMPSEPAQFAALLYTSLREADAMGAGAILVERPWDGPDIPPAWAAIADRLSRACANG